MAKARVVSVQFHDDQIDFTQYTHRLLAEGDSWFAWAHLNLEPSSNILEQLEFATPAVIVSLAYSGDVISNMSDPDANMHFCFELRGLRYDAILLSGGGNDLIDALHPGNGAPPIIVPCGSRPPSRAESYVDAQALAALLASVAEGYARIIAMRDESGVNRHTPIVLHTYDFPTPRNAKAAFMGGGVVGPWLLPAMKAAHVPKALYKDVTDYVFKALAKTRYALNDPANGIHVVKTHGTIERAALDTTALSGDWINEIHPDAHGYALIARKVKVQLESLGVN